MSHIFISYSKQDVDFVRYLRTLLEQEGFAVWVDEARLTPSTRWWKDIEHNIERCAAFLVVMTPDAAESDWVEREILLAESRKKPIYPVLLAGAPWSRLANIQYEDMRAGLRARLSHRLVHALREVAAPRPAGTIEFVIEPGNVLDFDADVLALKYAMGFHGADAAVARALFPDMNLREMRIHPDIGQHVLLKTHGAIRAPLALYIGVPYPRHFTYDDIRQFSARVLAILAREAPETRHVATTVHGPNAGKDEIEALRSQLNGCFEAIQQGQFPPHLQRITIVEKDTGRVARLRAALPTMLADIGAQPYGDGCLLPAPGQDDMPPAVETVAREVKPHAFVALPADADMDDIFYYGIQTPIHASGLLCERIGEDTPPDDLLEQARQRIETARVVVADLTGAHPLVCLQLGYAWGKGRPTILLTRDEAPFAVRDQPLYTYRRIKDVEDILSRALADLRSQAVV
jgi:hypothetical protein